MAEFFVGYGEKPFNSLIAIVIAILVYGFIYAFSGYCIDGRQYVLKISDLKAFNFEEVISVILKGMYFSYITLVTAGMGDVEPSGLISHALMCSEMFVGVLFITLFVSLVFRKMTK